MPTFFADIVHRFSTSSVRAQTGYTVQFANPDGDLLQAAAGLHQIWYDAHDRRLSKNWALDSTTVADGPTVLRFDDALSGEDDGDALVADSSLLVSKIPVVGAQGRMYVPGLNREWVTADGNFLSSVLQNWQDDYSAWLTALDAAGFPMVMRRPGGQFDPVTHLVVKPYLGTQRRRMIRSR